MGKTKSESHPKKSLRINVELAPGIEKMLEAYLDRENNSPKRSHPGLTLTDAVNAALKSFFETH